MRQFWGSFLAEGILCPPPHTHASTTTTTTTTFRRPNQFGARMNTGVLLAHSRPAEPCSPPPSTHTNLCSRNKPHNRFIRQSRWQQAHRSADKAGEVEQDECECQRQHVASPS